MSQRIWLPLLGGCLVVLLIAAPGGCKRDPNADGDTLINPEPLINKGDAEAPIVVFPEQCKTEDVTLNEFIRKALVSCQKGDYDQFRQLFGITCELPEGAQFERVWRGVKQISIAMMYEDTQRQPPEYYAHLVIQLRQPDRYERTERQAVIWVYKEGDEWRIAPAPSEVQRLILYPDRVATQPGSGLPTTRPTRRHATSRPAASRPTATSTSPAR